MLTRGRTVAAPHKPRQGQSPADRQWLCSTSEGVSSSLARPPLGLRALTHSQTGPTSTKPSGFHSGFRCSCLQGGGEQNLSPHSARWLDELALQGDASAVTA